MEFTRATPADVAGGRGAARGRRPAARRRRGGVRPRRRRAGRAGRPGRGRGRDRALRGRRAAAVRRRGARPPRQRASGSELVAAAEALAREAGIRDLYLLTETAIDWFPRLGYEVVERAVAAAAVGESIEFTTVCRDTGVPMHRSLA